MNPTPVPFDVFELPLGGLTVIEASAGTGKTYAISQLYVRLIIEQGLTVDRLLVVTYTKAATQELRTRLRALLADVRAALAGHPAKESFSMAVAGRATDRARAVERAQLALDAFDEAAIFTIHAFCQRVLAESAFESGAPFTVELLTDEGDLLQEAVDDFWRQHVATASAGFIQYLLAAHRQFRPDKLHQLLKRHIGRPDAIVRPAEPPRDVAVAEQAFTAARATARDLWPTQRAAVEAAFAVPALSKTKFNPKSVQKWLAAMDAWLSPPRGDVQRFDRFAKFTPAGLLDGTNKGKSPPSLAFFDVCATVDAAAAALEAAYSDRVVALEAQLLRDGAAQLAATKAARGLQSYDDLLQRFAAALDDGRRGARLALAVGARYGAALIDEFQDTDPVQYRIVRRIWGGGGLPVVLVGDPKQAIYSFRGADVVTYLEARAAAPTPRTLGVSWRADPPLLEAVAAVFGRHPQPFLLEEIQFQPVAAADQIRPVLVTPDDDGPAGRVWWLCSDDGGILTKGEARRRAADATADTIARLLRSAAAGRARLGERPLAGSDIAVLVRTHREGRMVRDALSCRGVASVQHALDSVFHTTEAEDVERLLAAVAAPSDGARVRAALATEIVGRTADELLRLATDEDRWEAEVEAFHGYHDLWRGHGFARMFRGVLAARGVAARLLAQSNGERRLTNVLHVGELLQAEASRHGDNIDRLLEWLHARRRERGFDSDEPQLRLESDEQLVQIVTIHRSKGLEYGIVFCPFLWDGRLQSSDASDITFHDPGAGGRVILDLDPARSEPDRERARREELAEHLRLAYVALTRARHRWYVVAGLVNEVGQSPLGWLFHAPLDAAQTLSLAAMAKAIVHRGEAALLADVQAVAAAAPGALAVTPLEAAAPQRGAAALPDPLPVLAPRRLERPVPPSWRMTSFSALTASHEAERPDYDAVATPRPAAALQDGREMADFPRGARAGRCLHTIFEHLDFTDRAPASVEPIIAAALAAHGFSLAWGETIRAMVDRVLATPLDAAGRIQLANVARPARLDELEFTHPVAALDVHRLRALLYAHGYDRPPFAAAVAALDFQAVHGFMKGFIDCVFRCDDRYVLIDYKSNWLGPAVDDYAADQLTPVIAREQYFLQYLIYTVVVHRLLTLRLPGYDYDRDFGGAYYLFLRGIDPRRGVTTGVYGDKPARALIEALDTLMATPAVGR